MTAPIWDRLVGQDLVVQELSRAVADAEHIRRGEPGPGMTHAWLVTRGRWAGSRVTGHGSPLYAMGAKREMGGSGADPAGASDTDTRDGTWRKNVLT